MKKYLITTMIALFSGLVIACSPVKQLSLTEADINQYLSQHRQYKKHIDAGDLLKAEINFSNLSIEIGRSDPAKIVLMGDADFDTQSILLTGKSHMRVKLEARPYFNAANGEIYLKEMKMVSYDVDSEKLQPLMLIVAPLLNEAIGAYFDTNPAYVLSAEKSRGEALAKKFAKGIEIQPGVIVIPFNESNGENPVTKPAEKAPTAPQVEDLSAGQPSQDKTTDENEKTETPTQEKQPEVTTEPPRETSKVQGTLV